MGTPRVIIADHQLHDVRTTPVDCPTCAKRCATHITGWTSKGGNLHGFVNTVACGACGYHEHGTFTP